jgi:hypothetical protein
MLLFRSEEHLQEWLDERGFERGGTMTVDTCWKLARTWYADKGKPGYRRRTPAEAQETFTSLGLTGPFWQLQSQA